MMPTVEDSPVFCMAPWVHMHIWPSGEVFPCCMTPQEMSIANLSESTLEQAWNSPKMKSLRQNIRKGVPSASCQRCYELEASGFKTLRQSLNKDFAHHISHVESTEVDGHVAKTHLPYFDIRFSNLCNFRCRSCGPQLSSSWYEDSQRLYDGSSSASRKVIRPTEDPTELWNQVEPHIDKLEQVYFAGGEPLFMLEHYQILEKLLILGKTDVRIRYNTNFSITKFQKYDVFEMWRQFESVEVGASLDAFGDRGEYLRKGQNWSQVVKNRERMMHECEHVRFFLSPTLSIMNAFQLPEFQKTWYEAGYIQIDDFFLNTLLDPVYYRIQVFPEEMKRQLKEIYNDHIQYLHSVGAKRSVDWFQNAIQFLFAEDRSHLLDRFQKRTRKLDEIREESIQVACPELAPLFD